MWCRVQSQVVPVGFNKLRHLRRYCLMVYSGAQDELVHVQQDIGLGDTAQCEEQAIRPRHTIPDRNRSKASNCGA